MYFKPRYLPQIEWELYVFSQLIPIGECLVWAGHKDPFGYGCVTRHKKTLRVHRLVYKLIKGKIPKKKVLDHLCRNTSCANPDHLEPVTDRENLMRGQGLAAQYAKRTHCKNGHEFNKANTYHEPSKRSKNARRCRMCKRISAREKYRRLRNV